MDQEDLQCLGGRGTQKKFHCSGQARCSEPPVEGEGGHLTDYSNEAMMNSVCIDANNPAGAGLC